jgi:hypothetical protein
MNIKGFLGVLMLIALLISLVGCGTPPANTTPPPSNEPAVNEPPQQVTPEPEPVKPALSQEITDVLAKSTKVSSYQYVFQSSETSKYTAKHYVKGDKLRIHYDSIQLYNSFSYFDIYIDKTKGLAYLVCDDVVACKGAKGKEVMYNEFNMETPLEVVSHIDNGVKVEDTEWDSKKTIVVSYVNEDGNDEKIWLWTYRGLPVKREITIGGKKVTLSYDNLVVDPAVETSVELPANLEMV